MLNMCTIYECKSLPRNERFALAYLLSLRGERLHADRFKIKIDIENEIQKLVAKKLIVKDFNRYHFRMRNILEVLDAKNHRNSTL